MGFGDVDLMDDGDRGGGKTASAVVSCSICLDGVTDNGARFWAKLQRGHQFHLEHGEPQLIGHEHFGSTNNASNGDSFEVKQNVGCSYGCTTDRRVDDSYAYSNCSYDNESSK
ncbi:unnamed protein product [Fraxinus pennsylvanica]|uniref:Uncharacterized protein n=1 Tax=Fraxinus pennsylvanica TaxID=56036 RepID=A0AAD1ZBF3_9LAMI|nr:unnamed protein product [Fraxinus pennsylvanica]